MDMSQLATALAKKAQKTRQAKQTLNKIAVVGTGIMKTEIQRMHAVDTGTMLNRTRQTKTANGYLIGPSVEYAKFVANGTRKMRARPFHITSARQLVNQIKAMNWRKELGL